MKEKGIDARWQSFRLKCYEADRLTARQIRYYEDQGLISPDRTEGNAACIRWTIWTACLRSKIISQMASNICG